MQSRQKNLIISAIVVALVLLSVGGIALITRAAPTAKTVAATAKGQATVAPSSTATPTAAATASPTATATPALTTPALSVQGTQFVDAAGHAVTLVGATRQSLEYLCHGDGHFAPADFQAMRSWGMNAVRITLSSEFWSAAGGGCADYHQTIATAVGNAEAAGLYVILTLQWDAPYDTAHDRTYGGVQCPMPDDGKDVGMWRDMAQIYRNDQRVLFDVFSEPHDVGWDTWLNGGTITNAACYIISQKDSIEPGSYHAIGMRDLVAAIRAISPQSIILLSGINWGYDLSSVGQGYAVTGSNIVYSTHPFDYASKEPANWPHDFGAVAQTYPVIAAEFGSYTCGTGYLVAAITYFKAHHISWLAWAWNVGGCSGPSLLADWSGAPAGAYGAYIRQQAQAGG